MKFHNLSFHKADFLESLKALSKIRELEIDVIFTTETDENFEDFELKSLTKLDISGPTNLGSFWVTIVPSSLKTFKYEGLWNCEIWAAELLGKLKHLEELNLRAFRIEDLRFDPENCHIEKLDFFVEFLDDSAFEKFCEFMKIQESVTEFKFSVQEDDMWDQDAGYTEILTHLLSLKSLKKFSLDCNYGEDFLTFFSHLKVCNAAVEALIVENPSYYGTDFSPLPKLFPNVTDLKITSDDWFYKLEIDDDLIYAKLQPINLMKMVRKLEIDYVTDEMLAQLEMKELRELCIKEIVVPDNGDGSDEDQEIVDPLADWRTFINNNSQLEVLHMLPRCRLSVEKLIITLENLPLLKSLELTVFGFDFSTTREKISTIDRKKYKTEQAKKAAKLIGECYNRFEHFKLDFDRNSLNSYIHNYLKKYYPGIKLES
jgi:hypothetical protein